MTVGAWERQGETCTASSSHQHPKRPQDVVCSWHEPNGCSECAGTQPSGMGLTPTDASPLSRRASLMGAVPGAPSPPSGSDGSAATSRRRGRGGRACRGGADHRRLGQHLHPPLLPRALRLPHLVGGCLPGRHQPLRPLLPPVPGSLLTGGSWDVPQGAVSAWLLVPFTPLCTCWWHLWTHTWGHLCCQLSA